MLNKVIGKSYFAKLFEVGFLIIQENASLGFDHFEETLQAKTALVTPNIKSCH